MNSNENVALYIAEECRKAGMTLAGAAGVLANIEAESAFKSTNLQDSYNASLHVSDDDYTAQVDAGSRNFIDSAGYGYCQWTAGDRKAKMLRFHRARGKSIGDPQTQIDFMLEEMRGYGRAWSVCTTSNDAYQCGYEVCRYYEIPANTDAQSKQRGSRALAWYSFLSHSGTASETPQETPQTDDDGIAIPKTWPPRTIDERCEGFPEIKLLQSVLVCHGYNVVIDGIFGESLKHKVIEFQTAHGLSADGVAGQMTWAKLLDTGG